MEFFKIKRDIPFMRHALIFNVISALTFVAAVFFVFSKGLHLSIEFTGGTVMEVAYPKSANIESIRTSVVGMGFTDSQVQSFGTAQDVLIRLPLRCSALPQRRGESRHFASLVPWGVPRRVLPLWGLAPRRATCWRRSWRQTPGA